MELFEQIRREYEHGGGTIRGIAKKLGVHRRMVREAVLSAVPVERKTPVREDRSWNRRWRSSTRFWKRTAGAPEAAAHRTSDLVPDPSGDAGSGSGRVHDTTPRSRKEDAVGDDSRARHSFRSPTFGVEKRKWTGMKPTRRSAESGS